MPLSKRLPSASGEIHVSGAISHPVWQNIPPEIVVSVWWPSQFLLEPDSEVCCLASYSAPGTGFQVADLRVSDVDESEGWGELEKAYGINLDPARIKGHPAIIEAEKGKGRLVLSYAHLETPGDRWGNQLFFNILNYLNDSSAISTPRELPGARYFQAQQGVRSSSSGVLRAKQAAADLIAFGEANLLWNWRKPWLLNWRRGIRGLEYGTLYVALCYMADLEQKLAAKSSRPGPADSGANWPERTKELEEKTLEFCALAKRLLFEEKIATLTGTVSKLGKVNERVDTLRISLFGNKMNHGGLSGALFDLLDCMLLDLIRAASAANGLKRTGHLLSQAAAL
jgi:hypothetical protein